ncbi:MAG: energy-coupling factor ABC transporter permease, partial [Waterburya sp.]
VRSVIGRDSWRGMAIATAVSAWTSVFVASILVATQLALSGTVPLNVAIYAMAFWHLLIGIGEALITLVVVSFIWRTRPDLIYNPSKSSKISSSRPLAQR